MGAPDDFASRVRRHRHEAMATTFELRLVHDEPDYALAAAEEAFRLVDKLEDALSRFREHSDIACIRALRDGEHLRVPATTFECLVCALKMHEATRGAFNPTLGPRDASAPQGTLVLHRDGFVVENLGGPVSLDLGAIGKGYALDRIAELFREWEITDALLSGGDSSLLAIGESEWKSTLTDRHHFPLRRLGVAASGAAAQGKHILDPITGEPCHLHERTWACAPTAAEADALSTAWMLLEPEEIAEICAENPGFGAAILSEDGGVPARYGAFPEIFADGPVRPTRG